jgi:hypothetical protein
MRPLGWISLLVIIVVLLITLFVSWHSATSKHSIQNDSNIYWCRQKNGIPITDKDGYLTKCDR